MSEIRVIKEKSPFWWVGWVPAAILAGALCVCAVIAGRAVLVPLLLSFGLAFLLQPLTDWYGRKRGRSRELAALLAMATGFLAIALLFIFLLPGIVRQFNESIEKIPLAVRAMGGQAQRLLIWARDHLSPETFSRLRDAINNLQNDTSAIMSRAGTWVSSGVVGLVGIGSTAVGLVIVPFFVYYLLVDSKQFLKLVELQIPERHKATGIRLINECTDVVRSYVQGRILIGLCMAFIYGTGLLILHVPLWAAIGLIAGFLGIIPYLGVLSGLALALGFAALDGAGIGRLLGVAIVFGIAQLIEDYVLTPRIIGDKLELHPMLVFLTLIVAGDLFGLVGLLLAIPTIAVLKVLVRFFENLYLESDFYRGTGPSLLENTVITRERHTER